MVTFEVTEIRLRTGKPVTDRIDAASEVAVVRQGLGRSGLLMVIDVRSRDRVAPGAVDTSERRRCKGR